MNLATPWLTVTLGAEPGARCTVSSDGNQSGGALTHILNKEGLRLRVHLDVLKAFQ